MKNLAHYSLLFFVLFLFLSTICFPQTVYQGALQGLETWAYHLVPSLLPFFIIAELFISAGLVRYLGVCLEPIMRPLFRLPGEAALAVVLGFTSGFPMGALLTASLYEQQLCTKEEAGRLVAFTNNASPLFLLIAVPLTMLEQPQWGFFLLAAHYGANLILGIFLGIFSCKLHPYQTYSHQIHHQNSPASPPLTMLHFPQMLTTAIQKGLKNIFSIGGFVLFFSILLALGNRLFPFLANFLTPLLEMTLGSNYIAKQNLPPILKLMLISFVIGWSGLSIQMQVLSILTPLKIPFHFYLICRPLQGTLAAFLVWGLYTFLPPLTPVGLEFSLLIPQSFHAAFFPAIAFIFLTFWLPWGYIKKRKINQNEVSNFSSNKYPT